ncbi:PE-PGRS family protein [Streptomyces himastatinicus ATCC 53653]|uniref:PE-PGRS family protein n=1 Tax=Streptomyces himastatinicus ATCC 53653 TaxID=457427 RepID=D9WTI5_9ACTN|nr:ABC transporter substrate-binding protein [Streptomyces himastatinicus]EFL28379.1 PE-PGRS family protein [Streptomyces himastatinicus ATCC 53653]
MNPDNSRAGRLLVACTALLLVPACMAGTMDSDAGEVKGGPTVRVALGVDASYAPFYLAKERGMFAKAGVNVELMRTEGGPTAGQAVTAGTAQLAANADSTALSLMAGDPGLRALGVFQSSGRYLKVVMRDGITSPRQIKTMASIQGLGLYATHAYLRRHGIDPASVTIHQSSPPEMPGLLQRGSIDAYVLYEPWAAKGAESGGHIAGHSGDFGVTYVQWLLAEDRWLKNNQEVAAKVFKVLAEADRMVTRDPTAAAAATNQQVKLPTAQTRKVLPEITFRVRGLTGADVEQSARITGFLTGQKLIKKSPDLDRALMKGWYERYAG